MSIGSKLIQGGVTLAAIISMGMTFNEMSHSRNTYQNKVSLLKDLKSEYAQDQKKKPTVEHVTTVYQRAVKVANRYLALQNQLHDKGQVPTQQQKPLLKKMDKLTTGSLVPNGFLIQPQIKDWHAEVSYGGQTKSGKVTMAYRWYNNNNGHLMRLDTFYYNEDSGKLSGFTNYVTKEGHQDGWNQVRQGDVNHG